MSAAESTLRCGARERLNVPRKTTVWPETFVERIDTRVGAVFAFLIHWWVPSVRDTSSSLGRNTEAARPPRPQLKSFVVPGSCDFILRRVCWRFLLRAGPLRQLLGAFEAKEDRRLGVDEEWVRPR